MEFTGTDKKRSCVCLQVAAFAATSMGAEAILRQQLPGGATQRHSDELLQQTAQAQEAGLRCYMVSSDVDLTWLAL